MKNRFLMLGMLSFFFCCMAVYAGSALKIQSFSLDASGTNVTIQFKTVAGTGNVYRVESVDCLTDLDEWEETGEEYTTDDEIIEIIVNVDQEKSPAFYRIVADVPALTNMVPIPGGTNSGTNPGEPGEHSSFYPQNYDITVDSFYMDRYLVTRGLWKDVRNWATNNAYSDLPEAPEQKGEESDMHPVHGVNWFDAVKWLNARSEKAGLVPVYYVDDTYENVYRIEEVSPHVNPDANGYRLPSMDQWEYAARGGLESKRFPWGDEISHDKANYRALDGSLHPDGVGYPNPDHPTLNTTPVDQFLIPNGYGPNGYGLYDMAGNLWEWNYDLLGTGRAVRGGDWHSSADEYDLRVGSRYHMLPDYRGVGEMGFRAVLPGQW